MKSQFVDKFNHDEDAAQYDRDVKNESNPIRAGYQDLLNWVANETNKTKPKRVLDLGVGTGNLSLLLEEYKQLVCIDASSKMLNIAKSKLPQSTQFFQEDLLAFFTQELEPFDAIISTYAIHHLTQNEKTQLFSLIHQSLRPGGMAVLGDLMFKNSSHKKELYRTFNKSLIEDIEDEFFWDLELAINELQALKFTTSFQQFSTLSWGILALK